MNVMITRRRKHEAEQAIRDLLKRGFYIVSPLKQVSSDGKTFTTDSYGRQIFVENTFHSCWKAVLRRDRRDEDVPSG